MPKFSVQHSVGFLVNRAAVQLKRELQQEFRRHGYTVTVEQWALLNQLWQQEGLYQVQLAELILKDKPNVGRMIEVLEKDGLIYRQRDDQDRRAYRAYLTPAGRQLEDQLVPLAVKVLNRALNGMSDQEIGEFTRILAMIDRNLDHGLLE
ncbi:MAG TPA: MarR family transcriptional regulator [Pseudonocardiaceae bacterium]